MILSFFFFFGKTHFEVHVLLLFFIFRHYTFILRHCILILLFYIDFVPQLESVEITLTPLNTQQITCTLKIKNTIKKIKNIYLNATYVNFFFFLDNEGVRASLRAPRLIPQVP